MPYCLGISWYILMMMKMMIIYLKEEEKNAHAHKRTNDDRCTVHRVHTFLYPWKHRAKRVDSSQRELAFLFSIVFHTDGLRVICAVCSRAGSIFLLHLIESMMLFQKMKIFMRLLFDAVPNWIHLIFVFSFSCFTLFGGFHFIFLFLFHCLVRVICFVYSFSVV